MKATCCCVTVLRTPLVRAARCYMTVFAYTTGEGNMLLRGYLRIPLVKATCCCVTVLRTPLVRAARYSDLLLRHCLAHTAGEGNMLLLRDCFLLIPLVKATYRSVTVCVYHRWRQRVVAKLFCVFHWWRQRVLAWLFLRVPLVKVTCYCVIVLRVPPVKATCCCVAICVYHWWRQRVVAWLFCVHHW